MSGIVAVTIRQEDGSLIKMSRKTGSYNQNLFFTPEFTDNDYPQAINNYVQSMVQPYEGISEMAPDSYGMVFIDFKDKEIYSLQDYDFPGHLILGELLLTNYKKIAQYPHVVELYKQDKLFIMGDDEQYTPLKDVLKKQDVLELADNILLNNGKPDYDKIGDLTLENFTDDTLKNWNIFAFDNLPQHYALFVKIINEKGIELSEDEMNSWKDFAIDATAYDEDIPEDMTNEEYIDDLFFPAKSKVKNKI